MELQFMPIWVRGQSESSLAKGKNRKKLIARGKSALGREK
jgi:hypothetical protein